MFWALLVVPSEATAPSIEYPDNSLVLIERNSLMALGIPFSPEIKSYGTLGNWEEMSPLLRKLALCESSLNPQAIGDFGTSFGLFQFKIKTWDLFCEGDIWNAKDQIRCAQKIIEQGKGKIHWRNCWRKENLDKFLKTKQN